MSGQPASTDFQGNVEAEEVELGLIDMEAVASLPGPCSIRIRLMKVSGYLIKDLAPGVSEPGVLHKALQGWLGSRL